ncbi:RluA family pseudouridine synthase [Marinilongibacter aquaticus]|uniref:RluA family pseudouridine synthase n=1 Tax=Marinilongibacter aquaticus TaxID=2975157 RepID=UPI0021BD44CF|nr:RluA family pseudouridine synthase [Marinilongibacter aquaticus]UBM60091.1 RluA family pseudouridine synthase [Marinilongibacter aquaticus]
MVLFEDDNYVVINKPPFVSSLPERTADKAISIQKLAKEAYDDIQLCHRLDKETSGILLLAKNSEAYRNAAMQFENREIKKEYHAVVNGVHQLEGVSVFLPIATLKDGTAVRIDKMRGKLAETVFVTAKAYHAHTLVRCYPITGRMHQIRVHLQCIEAPIVCDPTYGGESIYLSQLKRKFNLKKNTEELPLIKRVALHAHKLEFQNLDGNNVCFEAPYPKDFEVLVKQLDKFAD